MSHCSAHRRQLAPRLVRRAARRQRVPRPQRARRLSTPPRRVRSPRVRYTVSILTTKTALTNFRFLILVPYTWRLEHNFLVFKTDNTILIDAYLASTQIAQSTNGITHDLITIYLKLKSNIKITILLIGTKPICILIFYLSPVRVMIEVKLSLWEISREKLIVKVLCI